MNERPVASVVLITLAMAGVLASAAERTPKGWLDAMNRAFTDLDYDGTFAYYGGTDLATLRVVHMVVDGVERERLVHLNGAPREIVRTGDRVECILQPGDELIELESAIPAGPFGRAFSRRFDAIEDLYTIQPSGEGRVAGREAVRMAIEPKDENRYGYRLWLDRQTGLLLRSELHDPDGSRLEIFQFTSLRIGNIPRTALEPESAAGSVVNYLTLQSSSTQIDSREPLRWHVGWVPPGFKMSSADVRRTPSNLKAVHTLMYTDGLAAFSVYIEAMPNAVVGHVESRNGATVVVSNAVVGTGEDDHLVTVVGEVPVPTARRVAQAVYYRP